MQIIVSDLIATGLTQQELADMVPCGQSTISAYLKGNRGTNPSYQIGKQLEVLHKKFCSKKKSNQVNQ